MATTKASSPDIVEQLKLKGNEAFARKDAAEASSCYTQALEALGGVDDVGSRRVLLSNRSAARLMGGDYAGALTDAENCLAIAPGWSKALVRKGAALEKLARYADAARCFEGALVGDPENATILARVQAAKHLAANPPPPVSEPGIVSAPVATPEAAPVLTSAVLEDFLQQVAELESSTTNRVSSAAKQTNVDHEAETKGWTRENVLERLLHKHGKFLNLDPYYVFGLAHEANDEDVKRRYHKLSAFLHPDKNPDPRARDAFEVVQVAHRELSNPERRELYLRIFDECRARVQRLRDVERRKLGGDDQALIARDGTLAAAVAKEIKKVLATNEQDRLRAEELRRKNEAAIAEMTAVPEKDWAEVKSAEDAFKQGSDQRAKAYQEFLGQQSKRVKRTQGS